MKVFKYFVIVVTAVSVLSSLFKDVKGFVKGLFPTLITEEEKVIEGGTIVNDEVVLGLEGVYEYKKPNNTEGLNENHYIEFKENHVYYYGTSDDFDMAREGYLPGFFFKEVSAFEKKENNISFSIQADDSMFYKYQISPLFRTEHNENYKLGISKVKNHYEGTVSMTKDTIFINSKGLDTRCFVVINK